MQTVIVKNPSEEAFVKEVEDGVEPLQEIVGGGFFEHIQFGNYYLCMGEFPKGEPNIILSSSIVLGPIFVMRKFDYQEFTSEEVDNIKGTLNGIAYENFRV